MGQNQAVPLRLPVPLMRGLWAVICINAVSSFIVEKALFKRESRPTIESVGELARKGMKGTDEEIIELMIKNDK